MPEKISLKAINNNSLQGLDDGEIKKVRKRNGRVVNFDISKIISAVYKAMLVTREGAEDDAIKIARKVYLELLKKDSRQKGFVPKVEGIQDLVEKHLIFADFVLTAKAYILYRRERADLRVAKMSVSNQLRQEIKRNSKYFRNKLAEFIYFRTYSRWLENKGRRENWQETVDRYMDFMRENLGNKFFAKEYQLSLIHKRHLLKDFEYGLEEKI